MKQLLNYINGQYVQPLGTATIPVTNPATGETIASCPVSISADVAVAVDAAKKAFDNNWGYVIFIIPQFTIRHLIPIPNLKCIE